MGAINPQGVPLVGTASEIDVSGGAIGIADNPVIPGTQGVNVPIGTTVQRPGSPAEGLIRKNSTTNKIEAYEDGAWKDLITATAGGGSSALTVYRTSKTTISNGSTTTLSVPSATNGALSYDVKKVIAGGDDTLSLLHFNGTNGSTTITDSSQKNTYTAAGNAQIKTDQSKFGGASLYLDGTGDYVTAPDLSIYNLGTGDFTIEMWIQPEALAGTTNQVIGLLHQTNGGGSVAKWYFGLKKASSTTAYLNCHFNGAGSTLFPDSTNTHTVVDGNWHHVALVVSSGTGTFYFDGVADGTFSLTGGLPNSSGNLTIGRQEDYFDQYYQGWIDELRFTKTVIYSGNFTPSTSAFGDPLDDYNDIYVDSYDAGTAGFGAKYNSNTGVVSFINRTGLSGDFYCSALKFI